MAAHLTNRLNQAWQALMGRLEPSYVLADGASVVQVFMHFGYDRGTHFYANCATAHAAHPYGDIQAVTVLKIGGKFYRLPGGRALLAIEVQPKPKIAKGKRK